MNRLETALPLTALLPLRCLIVTLELTGPSRFAFYHQAAVHAFVRGLAGSPEGFAETLCLDAPESGRTQYRAGDRYRFTIIGLPGAEHLLARVIEALGQLPEGAPVDDADAPLRGNLHLFSLQDLFTGEPVRVVADLSLYQTADLAREVKHWCEAPFVTLQWLSPARLLLAKDARTHLRAEARFCHDLNDLAGGVLSARMHDSLADLLRRRAVESPPRQTDPVSTTPGGHLFWIDSAYRDADGNANPVGGLCGLIHLGPGRDIAGDALPMLVLGQYLGVGQRRAFGLGRYRLLTAQRTSTVPLAEPAASLLNHAARDDRLYDAYLAIRKNVRNHDMPAPTAEEAFEDDYPDLPDPETEAELADRLERLATRLSHADYDPPPLRGIVIRKADGGLRGLAVPPFWDRVLQRAVNDCVAPACDLLLSGASHGYRRGRSRHTASLDINRAWREGYRWIYEADIEDFFDSVDWRHLRERLEALYRDDPVVDLILAWMGATVEYQGFPIKRTLGLPQGAPLSPTMANLMLDDFDGDMERAGFKLVRYADDFVVLCRSRDEAEAAGRAVRDALAEIGLNVNEAKSRAVSFEQGFKFLGFLFMNDLIIDVGGETDRAQPSLPKPPPPHSWLARVGQRPARSLSAQGNAEEPAAATLDPNAPCAIGRRDDTGLLLIVSGRQALVSSRTGRVQVTRDNALVADAAWRELNGLLLLGAHHITTPALRHAMAADVPVHLASGGGHYQGVVWSARAGAEGAGLWLEQRARFEDPTWTRNAAAAVVMARIRHMREVLRQRRPAGFRNQRADLQEALRAAGRAEGNEQLLGIEGNATRVYFGALAELVPDAYGFDGRNKQPPRDPFNALLSLGYTLLHAHTVTLLRVAGLYPWLGFYHQPRGTHAALASDLMEPFRHLIERTALAAAGRGGIPPEQFSQNAILGCRLSPPALKRYLTMVWERLEHPINRVGEAEPRSALQQLYQQNLRLKHAIRLGIDLEPWVQR